MTSCRWGTPGSSGCPYVELSSQEVPCRTVPSIPLPRLRFASLPLPVDAAMIAGVSSFLSARATARQCPTVRFANLLSSLFARFTTASFTPCHNHWCIYTLRFFNLGVYTLFAEFSSDRGASAIRALDTTAVQSVLMMARKIISRVE